MTEAHEGSDQDEGASTKLCAKGLRPPDEQRPHRFQVFTAACWAVKAVAVHVVE